MQQQMHKIKDKTMAKKNEGKRFEEDFIKSLPVNVFRLRLKDAGGWSNADNTRFTPSNPCDFIIQDVRSKLHMTELKSHKGKSIPYSAMKQLDELFEYFGKYEMIECTFILNFRDLAETYKIDVLDLKTIQVTHERKSFSIEHIREYGTLIEQKLKRVRYSYNLDNVFKE